MTGEMPLINNEVVIDPSGQRAHQEAAQLIAEARLWAECADSEEDLNYRRNQVIEMSDSYYRCLMSLVMQGQHFDGKLKLSRDMNASLFFRFDKSGYHGGIIFHQHINITDGRIGRWSIHT